MNEVDEIKQSEDLIYSLRFKVFNFKKKWRAQIIVCCLNPVDFIVENFALSCVKNWYGGSFIATSSKKKLLNYESTYDNSERELLYNIPLIDFIKKYIKRGFQIMLGQTSFTDGPDELSILRLVLIRLLNYQMATINLSILSKLLNHTSHDKLSFF